MKKRTIVNIALWAAMLTGLVVAITSDVFIWAMLGLFSAVVAGTGLLDFNGIRDGRL